MRDLARELKWICAGQERHAGTRGGVIQTAEHAPRVGALAARGYCSSLWQRQRGPSGDARRVYHRAFPTTVSRPFSPTDTPYVDRVTSRLRNVALSTPDGARSFTPAYQAPDVHSLDDVIQALSSINCPWSPLPAPRGPTSPSSLRTAGWVAFFATGGDPEEDSARRRSRRDACHAAC